MPVRDGRTCRQRRNLAARPWRLSAASVPRCEPPLSLVTPSAPTCRNTGHRERNRPSAGHGNPLLRDAETCALLWMRYMGYRDAELTGSGPDGGLDVVADGAVAQVKFQAHTVGAPELQRLFGARVHATHRQLLFFTGTGYSPKAAAYAADAGIALFTYDPVGQAQPVNAAAAQLLARAQQDDDANPTRPPVPQRDLALGAGRESWRRPVRDVLSRVAWRDTSPKQRLINGGVSAAAFLFLAPATLIGVAAAGSPGRDGDDGLAGALILIGVAGYLLGLALLWWATRTPLGARQRAAALAAFLIAGVGGIGIWIALISSGSPSEWAAGPFVVAGMALGPLLVGAAAFISARRSVDETSRDAPTPSEP